MSRTFYRIQDCTYALPARWSYGDVSCCDPGVGCQVWGAVNEIRRAIDGEDFDGVYEGTDLIVIEASSWSDGCGIWYVVDAEDVGAVYSVDLFVLRSRLALLDTEEMDSDELDAAFLSLVEELKVSRPIEWEDTLDGQGVESIEETYEREGREIPVLAAA